MHFINNTTFFVYCHEKNAGTGMVFCYFYSIWILIIHLGSCVLLQIFQDKTKIRGKYPRTFVLGEKRG